LALAVRDTWPLFSNTHTVLGSLGATATPTMFPWKAGELVAKVRTRAKPVPELVLFHRSAEAGVLPVWPRAAYTVAGCDGSSATNTTGWVPAAGRPLPSGGAVNDASQLTPPLVVLSKSPLELP
jgi:hypothetical protein